MKLSHILIVAGGLMAAGSASFAASGETMGQRLADGSMSQEQFQQLIQFTGLTADQAKQDTLDQIVAKRWQQN